MLILVLAAGYAQQWRRVELLADPEPDVRAAADVVAAATGPGDTIVSDLPIVAHLAERSLPGELVDTSFVRFESGSLDAACVLAATDAAGARVAVVGRMFRSEPAVLAGLETRFPERRTFGEITVLERTPAAAQAARRSAHGPCSTD